MKVYEIITEAPKAAAPVATSAPIIGAPPAGATGKSFWSWGNKALKNSKVKKVIEPKVLAKTQIISGYVIKPLLVVFRIYDQVIDLYEHLSLAEELYANGTIDADRLKRERAWYIGMWEVQVLAPMVARTLMISRVVALVARAIVTLATATLGAAGAIPTGGAAVAGSVAAMVAEQAFFIWLQKWLQSEQAQNFLTEHVLMPIITMGKVSDNVWDTLTGYYKKADEKKAVTPQVPNAVKSGPADTSDYFSSPTGKTQLKPKMSDAEYARANAPVVMDKDPKTGRMVTGISDPATGKFIPSSEL